MTASLPTGRGAWNLTPPRTTRVGPAEVSENCSEAYVDEQTIQRVLEIAAAAQRDRATVLVRAYASAAA